MKITDTKIQNAIVGAFAFAMGLVVIKIISKHFGNGNIMAGLPLSASEPTASYLGEDEVGCAQSAENVYNMMGSSCKDECVNSGGDWTETPTGDFVGICKGGEGMASPRLPRTSRKTAFRSFF
jgi:hypothetical protein